MRRTTKFETLSPNGSIVGGKGWGEGALFGLLVPYAHNQKSPSLLTFSPASGGERNGMSRALRPRQARWIEAERYA